MGSFHAFVIFSIVSTCYAVNCDEYQDCALGALRDAIINHKGASKNHSLVRAMLRYKEHPECTQNDQVLSQRTSNFPDHVSVHGPQCESRFSFTTAEGFIGHVALIFNVALATLWYDVYQHKKNNPGFDNAEESETLLS